MKSRFITQLLFIVLVALAFVSKGQTLSPNTITYKLTYDFATNKYTVWVVPEYSVPNSYNTGSTEKGATAQVTLAFPTGFQIQNITSIKGTWATDSNVLGPGQTGQTWPSTLPSGTNYKIIGKTADETDYGSFTIGTPVALFTFEGASCLGPVRIISANDPFVAAAENQYSFNAANSFYSQSGQPAGGNQNPQEQFRAVSGTAADCTPVILANPNTQTVTGNTTTSINVLGNDTRNGAAVTSTTVSNPTIISQPANGTVTVNSDGTISYVPPTDYIGTTTFVYQICDKVVTTACDTARVTLTVNCPTYPTPTLSATSTAICSGNSTTLSGTGCTTGTLTWYTDSGLNYPFTNLTVSPTSNTAYYAACINSTGTCKSPAASITITVNPTPLQPTTLSASPNPVCSGNPVTLSGNCASGTLTWYSNSGLTTSVTSPVTPLTTTTYYATCKTTTCESVASSITVTVNPTPSAPSNLAGSPNPVCAGNPVTLTGTCSNGGNIQWYTKADLSEYAPSTVNPTTNTTYYATCKTSTCESSVSSLAITVNPTPAAPTSLSVSPNPVCSGNPVTLSGTCASGTTIKWYKDSGLTQAETSTPTPPSTSTTSPTVTTYYAACETATCKSAASSITVTVNPTPAAPTGLSASPNPVCSGNPVTLTGTCATGSIKWYSNSALTVAVGSTVTPTASTTYYATCETTSCRSAVSSIAVTVNPTPATPTVSANSLTNVCPALKVDLTTLTTPVSGVTYEWHTANNTLASTLVSDPTNVTTSSTYYVFAKGTAGCYSTSSASVLATINPCIVANPNTATTQLNTPTTTLVLNNDTNNGSLATTSNVTLPTIVSSTNGTATVNANGTITFTPATGFVGTTTYIYQICDAVNTSICDTAKVTVTIDCPFISSPTNAKATPASICIGQSTTLTADACTGGATLKWYADATLNNLLSSNVVSPTTTTKYYGACVNSTCKSSAVEVTVTNTGICNAPPVATNDIVTTPQDKPVSGNVLTNDDDPNNNPLTVSTTPVTSPTKGTVTINPDGTFTYTPTTGATGQDTFCYKVCDNASPSLCDTACVTVNLVPPPTSGNDKPVANDDNTQTTSGTPIVVNVKANDTDPDGTSTLGTPTKITNPTNGTVTQNPDGTFTYTPTPGYTGTDTFTYQICDTGTPTKCDTASVTVNILPTPPAGVNQAPVAVDDATMTIKDSPVTGTVAANDSDPESSASQLTYTQLTSPTNGTVSLSSNGTYTYTPAAGYTGSDTYTYKVCDPAGKCDTATVTIAVLPPPPGVCLLPKAYLQGALFGVNLPDSLMRDDLRVKGLLPTTSPYPAIGWNGITSANTASSAVLGASAGKDAIVDWVFVELRSTTTTVVDSRSALIQRDGDIVDVDGVSPVRFTTAFPGSYYVVVRHRNHLGVMTKTAVALSSNCTTIDFRKTTTPNFVFAENAINKAQVDVQQGLAMWAGNANRSIIPTANAPGVGYQGSGNDVEMIYNLVLNAAGNAFKTPYYKLKSYNDGDINLNGETIFQGTGNDVEFIYQNIMKNHPGNTFKLPSFVIKEQLP